MGGRGAFLAAAIALTLVPFTAAAQQAQGASALLVTRLKAEASEAHVTLTWKDAGGTGGANLVYRSLEELTATNLDKAQLLGRVPMGAQNYIDTPPDQSSYFYAVLIEGEDGKVSSLLIPYRNKTSLGVSVNAEAAVTQPEAAAPEPAPAAAPQPEPAAPEPPAVAETPKAEPAAPEPIAKAPQPQAVEETSPAYVTEIRAAATPNGDGIEISFRATNPARDLILFWGGAPVATAEDLLRSTAKVQLDAGTSSYLVATLAGVDYWFTVLDAGLYKLGKITIEKGTNTTAAPVRVPIGSGGVSLAASASRRALQLPSLELAVGVESGLALPRLNLSNLPALKKVSPETEDAIAALRARIGEPATRGTQPQVLPADAAPTSGGESSLLHDIVTGPFAEGDMTAAAAQLDSFLDLRHTPEADARARFYRGQVYYFSGKFRESLLDFLLAEDTLYRETQTWKSACYRALEAGP